MNTTLTSLNTSAPEQTPVLKSAHYRELIEKRGLPIDWVLANCRSITIEQATELLGYKSLSPGIWLQGTNSQCQFRPDKPWVLDQTRKAPKYRTPRDGDYDAMLPTHPTIKDYWHNLEALKERCWKIDGHPYIIITEGFLKAIAGCSNNLPTVPLLGVEMGLTSTKGNPQGKRYLVPVLEKLAHAGFGFIIALDADCVTNPAVLAAEKKLTYQLKKFNAPVRSITGMWEPGERGETKGMDDFIKEQGIEEFRAILLRAEERQWNDDQPREKKPPTPKALGDELADKFRDRWAYDLGQQAWRIWNETIWEKRHDKAVLRLLKTQVQAMNIDYPRETYIKDALESLSLIFLKETWESYDRAQWIAGSNGVLNTTTGLVTPHNPVFGFTSVLPHEVRPFQPAQTKEDILTKLRDDCPEIYQFFSASMLGDQQKILKLVAVVAAILRFRLSRLQKFIHLIGEPGTGKGTFMRLLKDVVGSANCKAASLTNLDDGSVIARIIDAQLVLFPDERKQAGVEWLLKLTGEDDIDYREVYSKASSCKFHGSIVVASNNAVFAGDTTGLDRRLCLIPFQNSILDHQRDPDLQDHLRAEVPNLVSVALAMPLSFIDDLICGHGIGQMKDTRWHEWQMKLEVDKVATFLDEMIVRDEGGRELAGDLFQAYLEWAKNANHSSPGSQTFFGGRISKHLNWLKWTLDKSKAHGGKSVYKGIRLRYQGEESSTISELLSFGDSAGTVQLSPGDSTGTVSNPLQDCNGDSGDSLSQTFLQEAENSKSFNSHAESKKFSPETIPTIPNQVSERNTTLSPTVPGGQLEPSPTVHPDKQWEPGNEFRYIGSHKPFQKYKNQVLTVSEACQVNEYVLAVGVNDWFHFSDIERVEKDDVRVGQWVKTRHPVTGKEEVVQIVRLANQYGLYGIKDKNLLPGSLYRHQFESLSKYEVCKLGLE